MVTTKSKEARVSVIQKIMKHGEGAQIPKTLCLVVENVETPFCWEEVTPKMSPFASLSSLTEKAKSGMGRALASTFFSSAEIKQVQKMIEDGTLVVGEEQILHGRIIRHVSLAQTLSA